MKVLWLCNIMIPKIAESLSLSSFYGGGWLTGLSNDLTKVKEIELAICFPSPGKGYISGKIENIKYYGFPRLINYPTKYEKNVETELGKILEDFSPDIVHIFGTEHPHSLAMTKVFNNPRKTIVNIQGLTSVYFIHFTAGLPNSVCKRYSFRDFIRRENIYKQKDNFRKRGNFEIETIKSVNNIVGRTDWDRACSEKINPSANYFFCNETLRDSFYNDEWEYEKCARFSIFLSQGDYPIKGLHFLIEALKDLVVDFPQTKVYVAGHDLLYSNSRSKEFRITYYGMYILKMIKDFKLEKNIVFTGVLNEAEICTMFKSANVFVSCSSIENSPNSLGEAMLLGVPCVVSDVGGIKNFITHDINGYIYQYDAPYMLAYYIRKLFVDKEKALEFSRLSKIRSSFIHNRKVNLDTMLDIYQKINRNGIE